MRTFMLNILIIDMYHSYCLLYLFMPITTVYVMKIMIIFYKQALSICPVSILYSIKQKEARQIEHKSIQYCSSKQIL